MTRALRYLGALILFLPCLALFVCAAAMMPAEAGASGSEPTCSASVTGPYVQYGTPTTYSVTCTGVTGDLVSVNVAVPGGTANFSFQSADRSTGPGPTFAALPTSFTATESTSTAPCSTDATPTALCPIPALYLPSGTLAPAPDTSTAQNDTNDNPDTCFTAGTGCGTPTSTLTGFTSSGAALETTFTGTTTTLLEYFGYAVALIAALLLIALATRMLFKYAKKGAAGT